MRRIGTMAVENASRTRVIMLTPQRLAGVAVLRMDEVGRIVHIPLIKERTMARQQKQ